MGSIGLKALLGDVEKTAPGLLQKIRNGSDVMITAITEDSRRVSNGSLFCALRGVSADGHDHVADAIRRGAVAVLVERPTTDVVPEIFVRDSRSAIGHIASSFEGHPSAKLDLVGVTGTNGKTSIVTLIAHLANHAGRSGASMGTLTGALTTSAAPQFQEALRKHLDDGCDLVAAEVSSHALDQERIVGSRVRVAVFSNLSQDHLDYHRDMDDYFAAKARLFSSDLTELAVIDTSDTWGARLADETDIPVIRVDTESIARTARVDQYGSLFTWRTHDITLPLGGRFSVKNALLAAEACLALGITETAVVDGLNVAPQIPGRFESVDVGQPFAVIVDYSHTPASVAAAIASARDLARGRVLIVFGAAGDRDPGKRPLMGAAAREADVVYVTSDNPRTEDPRVIIDEVIAGLGGSPATRIEDRAEAIAAALAEARDNDVVVIAGKGHEDYQIIGTTRRHFDDREVARTALRSLGWENNA